MTRFHAVVASYRENILAAFRSIRELKLRSFLTCLGIIIGVGTVVVMVALVDGFNRQFIASFQSFGATLVQFQKQEDRFGGGPPPEDERLRPNLVVEDAEAIQRNAWAISYVSPERWQFQGIDVRFRSERANGVTVGGVTHEYPFANNHWVQRGRFFSAAEERHQAQVAVIGEAIANSLFPTVDPLGRVISLNGRPLTVVGVFEKKGSFLDGGGADLQMVIPMGMFDRLFPNSKKTYGCVIATVPARPEWVEMAIEQGTSILRERRGLRFWQPNNFAVRTPDRAIRTFRQITGGVSTAMMVIAAISLIIGGVGVMNIMLMNVTQRTREIGVRRAIGARQRDIRQQFRTEAITLASVGGAMGVAVGIAVAKLIGAVSPFPTMISVGAIVAGLAVSCVVGYLFGTYPAYKAARLDPIEALRYE